MRICACVSYVCERERERRRRRDIVGEDKKEIDLCI